MCCQIIKIKHFHLTWFFLLAFLIGEPSLPYPVLVIKGNIKTMYQNENAMSFFIKVTSYYKP